MLHLCLMAQDQSTNDQTPRPQGNAIKNPDDWTTGDEPMTGAQRSYLHTLATEAGEEVDDDLTNSTLSDPRVLISGIQGQ